MNTVTRIDICGSMEDVDGRRDGEMDVERRIWRWGPRANATTSPEESTDSDVPRGFNRLLAFPASNASSKWIKTLEILVLTASALKGVSPSRRESVGALEGPEVVCRQTLIVHNRHHLQSGTRTASKGAVPRELYCTNSKIPILGEHSRKKR